MSENSSEFLKRTCLICGCHTNQTINIYEPRSGPNIVQLIQAKFKFQPLNEDKYLCFSCNNWLINWHSLQALNSNDAESPSGTFRSHLNSGSVVQDEKSSGSKKQVAICRPIAQVKPMPQEVSEKHHQQQQQQQQQETMETNKTLLKINFNKRNFRLQLAKRAGSGKIIHKSMQQCSCGKYLVVRSMKNCKKSLLQTPIKCRKCREFSRLKACYLRSIVQVEKELAIRETPIFPTSNQQNLVIQTENDIETQKEADTNTDTNTNTNTPRTSETKSQSINQQQHQQQQQKEPQQIRHHYLPKPTIDGKVVSMLRRLGTTLSRETQTENGREHNITTSSSSSNINNLPQIMSPTKPKAKWCRPLDDDEILVNFDSNISEVLPSLADQFTNGFSMAAKKRLEFQISETTEVIDLCNEDHNNENNVSEKTFKETEVLKTTHNLPKGLSITLL